MSEKQLDNTNKVRYTVYKRDGFRCTSCGKPCCAMTKRKKRIDNLSTIGYTIPISRGGTKTLDNMKTLCYSCNKYKGGWIKTYNRNKTIVQISTATRKQKIKSAKKNDRERTKKALRRIASGKLYVLLAKYGPKCYICQTTTVKPSSRNMKPNYRTIDHVVSITNGGDSRISNLRICCYKCNQEKGSK